MNFKELLTEELDIGDVVIEEGADYGMYVTPLFAYLSMKENILDKIKKKGIPRKAQRAVKKEKELAKKEKKSVDVTYKFTPEQKKFIRELKKKYGKDLISEIKDFRVEILAPYQVLKRQIKSTKKITSKEVFGLTHEEFKKYESSGAKKIGMLDHVDENVANENRKIDRLKEVRENLEKLVNDFKTGKGEPKQSIIDKVLKYYNLSGVEYSNETLGKAFRELTRNQQRMNRIINSTDLSSEDRREILDLINRNEELRKNPVYKRKINNDIPLSKEEKEEIKSNTKGIIDIDKIKKSGKFEEELRMFFLRDEAMNLLKPGKSNKYTKLYIDILNKNILSIGERIKESFNKISKLKSGSVLNDQEKKIYRIKSGVKEREATSKSFNKMLDDDDFFGVMYSKKSEKIINAEKEIDALMKEFERRIKKIVSEEDYKKLKQLRLINNLVTIKELSSPQNMFKNISSEEWSEQKTDNKEESQEE